MPYHALTCEEKGAAVPEIHSRSGLPERLHVPLPAPAGGQGWRRSTKVRKRRKGTKAAGQNPADRPGRACRQKYPAAPHLAECPQESGSGETAASTGQGKAGSFWAAADGAKAGKRPGQTNIFQRADKSKGNCLLER